MLNTEKTEVLAELDKVHRRRGELWCEADDMIRAKERGCPPSSEEIQDYRTRKKEAEADYQLLIERLRGIMRSESKPNELKHTPPAKSAANSTPHRRRDNGSDNGGLFRL